MSNDINARLPVTHRVRLSSDFGRVYAGGLSARGRYLVAWFLPDSGQKIVRLGVVASKRSLRRAHERNRAKRLLREVFRKNRSLFSRSGDCILIARSYIRDAGESDVLEDLRKALGRLK